MRLIASRKTCGRKSPCLKYSNVGDITPCILPTKLIDGKTKWEQQFLGGKRILQSYLFCSNLYLALQEYHNRFCLGAVHEMSKAVVAKEVVEIDRHVTCKMLPGQSKPQRTSAQLLAFPLLPIQR